MNVKPVSTDPSKASGSGCAVAFGGLFFVIGLIFFWFVTVSPWLKTLSSGDWIQTPCTITASEIDVDRDDDGTTYRPHIEFRYQFDEAEYLSDTFDFTALNRSKSRCREIVNAHPIGALRQCYVDPDDHEKAVIDRDYEFSLFGTLFPLFFSGIGLAIGLSALLFKKSKPTMASESRRAISKGPQLALDAGRNSLTDPASQMHPGDVEDQMWDQPQKLKPDTTRLFRFLITLFLALFWNGIVSIFVISIVNDGFQGFAIFPALFLIPFVLVGIGLIGASLYSLAGLFNPRIELALSTGAVGRGDTVDIAWQVSGRASSIRLLKVTVEGEESATYRRGTDTITDRHVFCRIPVYAATSHDEIVFGSQSVEIPADTMHTFSAGRNNIQWRIKVAGEIPFWPDIDENFGFRVKP